MKQLLFRLISMWLTVGILSAKAQVPTLSLSPDSASHPVKAYFAFWEDKKDEVPANQVTAGMLDKQFKPFPQKAINFGVTRSAIWIKFSLRNSSPKRLSRWLLELDYPLTDFVTLYRPTPEGGWQTEQTGDGLPYWQRVVPHRKFVFVLTLPDSLPRTYYMRFMTSGSMQIIPNLTTEAAFLQANMINELGYGIFFGALLIMSGYNLLLFFSLKNRAYLAYVAVILSNILLQAAYTGHLIQFVFGNSPYWANHMVPLLMSITPLCVCWFSSLFLNTARLGPIIHRCVQGVMVLSALNALLSLFLRPGITVPVSGMLLLMTFPLLATIAILSYRKGNKAARFFLIAWGILIVGGVVLSLLNFGLLTPTFLTINSTRFASMAEVILLAIALADQYNLYKQEKEAAQQEIVRMQRETNQALEQQVTQRTEQLNQSLERLMHTQNQLIYKEKMASLGELTAGIAHEIQNPLNFVNNFAELSIDLLDELQQGVREGDETLVQDVSVDLQRNLDVINKNGKRASSIIRSMLDHSRTNPGERQLMNLNALVKEFMNLSYHGFRANNKDFNVAFRADLNADLQPVELEAQGMGSVLINLFNNAFYAVLQKQKKPSTDYEPTVWVTTRQHGDWIELRVRDNGTGIPATLVDKVFHPFFTTKPTGQGTGLGMSLAYEAITKGHNGTIRVESEEGLFTEFIIRLPVST